MNVLKEYKGIILSGVAVLLCFVGAFFVVGNTEQKNDRMNYAEHIFQEGTVSEIDIQIDEADWQDMMENPMAEEFHRANVTINGELMGNVAIRTKGNTSLSSVANSDSDRYSFKIDFDYYDDNGNYYGLRKLCLNNNFADDSYMREYICYKIMEDMGLPVPACGYTHITVNGEEWGLYLAVEPVDEVFLQTRFADATGDLYKPEGMGGTGADLVYRSDNISDYTGLHLKTNLESSDGSEVIALMKALESGEGLEEVLDIENALKYIAANVALANFDSYLGGTTHNYYLYEENGVFSMIPWDINLAFGSFGGGEVNIYEPASGFMMGGGRGGNRSAEGQEAEEGGMPQMGEGMNFPAMGGNGGMPQMPEGMNFPARGEIPQRPEGMNAPANGEMPQMPEGMSPFGGNGGKPLVDTLMANETYLAMYEGYMKTIAETYLTEEYMAARVTEIHDLIAPYVEQDATAFCTYEEFEQACSADPTDEYSLVYYAVNMAASIQNQLAGGEPTFDTGTLKGGGMGFGGGMPDFGGEMPAFGEMPDFGGEMPAFGEMPAAEDTEGQAEGQEQGMPPFGGQKERGGMPPFGGRMQEKVELKEVLPEILICGGIFLGGLAFAIFYKRKKDLK